MARTRGSQATPPSSVRIRPHGDVPIRTVIGAFAVALLVCTALATWGASRGHPTTVFNLGPPWLDAWIRYDAGWYTHIAAYGYEYLPGQQSSVAFFPAYPLAVRGISAVTGHLNWIGPLVTMTSGLTAVVLIRQWCLQWLSPRAVTITLAAVLLYPYAVFIYGAMYADALFLVSAVGAFVCVERRWYAVAGLLGAVATAGRPVGVAVAVGLVVRVIEHLAQDRAATTSRPGDAPVPLRALISAIRDTRLRHAGVALSALGLVGWMGYLWASFGDPLAFVAVESAPGWNQGVGPRTWFKVAYLSHLLRGPWELKVILTAQAFVVLMAVFLLRRVWRRFGWGYLAYCGVVLAIPLVGTKDFLGCGRYVLAAFPVFAAYGAMLADHRRQWVVPVALGIQGVGLAVACYFYGSGALIS